MIFRKIDDNKIMIILSVTDLEENDIDFKNMKSNSVAYQQMFWNMMEQAQQELDFDVSNSQLLVETAPDPNGNYIITITKSNAGKSPLSDLEKLISGKLLSLGGFSGIMEDMNSNALNYDFSQPESIPLETFNKEIVKFNNIENLILLCQSDEEYKVIRSKLYEFNKNYYLIINRTKKSDKLIDKMVNYAAEFDAEYPEAFLSSAFIEEHGKVLIKTKAIKVIAEKFQ